MSPLWTAEEIVEATGGMLSGGDFHVSGVTFDSREVEPGWLFVAMPGTVADGHDFVAKAQAQGAVGCLVSRKIDGPHILVDDVPRALDAMARAARRRMTGKVIGVTGSVGKTSTKEALYAALDRASLGRAHRSLKSYNNHTGVPLSLARMPRETRFAVQEMGMNNAGEIAALTRLVRPHVAVVTTIASAHIENLGSLEAIADAKAEIFEGLEPGGAAIIPEDSDFRDRLARAAARHAERTITFGTAKTADVHPIHAVKVQGGHSMVSATSPRGDITFTIAQRGDHWVANALTVLAVVDTLGADRAVAGLALADMSGLSGRGKRRTLRVGEGDYLLVDESYNANPASMAATLKALGEEAASRRIAVLGPMRELGPTGPQLHAALAEPVRAARVDLLILVGEDMAPLAEAVAGEIETIRVGDVGAAGDALEARVEAGDAVLVKASNSIGLAKLVQRMAGG